MQVKNSEYTVVMKAGDIIDMGESLITQFNAEVESMNQSTIDWYMATGQMAQTKGFLGLGRKKRRPNRTEAIEYLDGEHTFASGTRREYNESLVRAKYSGVIELIEGAKLLADPTFEITVTGTHQRILYRAVNTSQ